MSFSLSIREGHKDGSIRLAISSSLNASDVTANAMRAAFLAWMKGSRRDRVNAAIKTLDLVLVLRFLEIFPKHIVVFVRIPGCSSFEVLARYFKSSPLTVRSDSFPIIVRTALTVCSRTTGATSVNPVTCHLRQLSECLSGQVKYHLRKYLIIDNFLWQSVDHQW